MGQIRNHPFEVRKGGINIPPFLLYGILLISLIDGGTSQLPMLLIRSALVFIFLILLLKGNISYPEEFSLPLVAFSLFSLFCFATSMRASAVWPSLQWSLNIITIFFFLLLIFEAVSKDSLDYISFVELLSLTVFLELIYQLFQKYYLSISRPAGTFFNANFLGEFYSMAGCILISIWLFKGKRLLGRRYLFIIPFIASLAGIVLTGSRGSALAFIGGVTLVLIFRFRLKAVAITALLLFLLFFTPNPVAERFMGSSDIYSYSRINIYHAALSIFGDNKGGIGLGNFKYYFPAYNLPIYNAVALFGKYARTAHNEHLQVLVELGLVGMFLYLFLIISLAIRVVFWKCKSELWVKAGVSGALLSFFIHASVDSVYHTFALPLFAMVLVGFYASEQDVQWKAVTLTRLTKWGGVAVCTLLLMMSLSTTSSYYLSSYGKKLIVSGEYGRAVKPLKMATWIDPLNVNHYDLLASAKFQSYLQEAKEDDFMASLKYLNAAAGINEKAASIYDRIGFVLSKGMERGTVGRDSAGGAAREAIDSYLKYLELNPYDIFVMKNLALLYLGMKEFDRAEKLLKKAISTEPNFASGYYLLGKSKEIRGNVDEAAYLYKKSYSIYKEYSETGGLESYTRSLVGLKEAEIEDLRKRER